MEVLLIVGAIGFLFGGFHGAAVAIVGSVVAWLLLMFIVAMFSQ